MNRKYFLSLFPASLFFATSSGKASNFKPLASTKAMKIPAYLKPGDTIGITCPAGFITALEIEPCIIQMKSWGFNVVIGKTVGAKDHSFGGTDNERLTDLQEMLNDNKIQAIMCARGGYGAIRILDQLDSATFGVPRNG